MNKHDKLWASINKKEAEGKLDPEYFTSEEKELIRMRNNIRNGTNYVKYLNKNNSIFKTLNKFEDFVFGMFENPENKKWK